MNKGVQKKRKTAGGRVIWFKGHWGGEKKKKNCGFGITNSKKISKKTDCRKKRGYQKCPLIYKKQSGGKKEYKEKMKAHPKKEGGKVQREWFCRKQETVNYS